MLIFAHIIPADFIPFGGKTGLIGRYIADQLFILGLAEESPEIGLHMAIGERSALFNRFDLIDAKSRARRTPQATGTGTAIGLFKTAQPALNGH